MVNSGEQSSAAMKLKDASLWKKNAMKKTRPHIKKQRYHLTDKGPHSQSYGFSSSHVWIWELDHKESWAPKNWCLWIVELEETLESSLDSNKISETQREIIPEYSLEWLMLKLKLQYFGHLMGRADSLEKTLMLGKSGGKEEGSCREWDI